MCSQPQLGREQPLGARSGRRGPAQTTMPTGAGISSQNTGCCSGVIRRRSAPSLPTVTSLQGGDTRSAGALGLPVNQAATRTQPWQGEQPAEEEGAVTWLAESPLRSQNGQAAHLITPPEEPSLLMASASAVATRSSASARLMSSLQAQRGTKGVDRRPDGHKCTAQRSTNQKPAQARRPALPAVLLPHAPFPDPSKRAIPSRETHTEGGKQAHAPAPTPPQLSLELRVQVAPDEGGA